MVYLLFSVFSVAYVFLLEKKCKRIGGAEFIFAIIPFLYFYFLFPAIQFDVGTDYFRYLDKYENLSAIRYYDLRGEFYFSAFLRLNNFFKIGDWFVFPFYSFTFSCILCVYLVKLKNEGVYTWLFLFLLLFSTGVYQNQMNGLRQFSAVYVLMLLVFSFYKKENVKSFLLLILGQMMHSSFILNIPLLIVRYIKITPLKCLFAFFVSFFVFGFIIPYILPFVISVAFPQYMSYLSSDLMAGHGIVAILPKIYYAPLVILFLYFYNRGKVDKEIANPIILKFCFLSCLLFWCFLSYGNIGIMTRVGVYWVLFNCFPIYCVLRFLSKSSPKYFFVGLLYISFPFFIKVLVFPQQEYFYKSILW